MKIQIFKILLQNLCRDNMFLNASPPWWGWCIIYYTEYNSFLIIKAILNSFLQALAA